MNPRRLLPLGTLFTRERLAALFLFLCAGICALEAHGLRMGPARSMGPGYFPWILGGLFALFGLIVLLQSRGGDAPLDPGPLRPVLWIIGGVAAFAVLLPLTGAAVALIVLVVMAALAESGRRPLPVLMLALVLVAMVWLVFRLGLKLQLPMLPGDRG